MFLFRRKRSRIKTVIVENDNTSAASADYLEIKSFVENKTCAADDETYIKDNIGTNDTNDAISTTELKSEFVQTTVTVNCCSSVFNIETLFNLHTCPNCNSTLNFVIKSPKKHVIDKVYKSYQIKYIDFILNLNFLLVYCNIICTQVYKVFGRESRLD